MHSLYAVLCDPNYMGLLAFANRFCAAGYAIDAGAPAGNITFITHSGSSFDAIWRFSGNVFP